MESILRLFKGIEIKSKRKKQPSKVLLKSTIERGFVFSPEVIFNYTEKELLKLAEKIGLNSEQMNSSFHKSWKKVKEASIEQLFIEQILHYFTTYGFERFDIYNEESVYIPNEKLEVPEIDKEGIKLIVIKGYTRKEIKEKLLDLLGSGIALGEDTLKDVVDVAVLVEIEAKEIDKIKNKEVKVALYDYLDLFPENPIEFLRYIIFKSTSKTLLIKDETTIEAIKENDNNNIVVLLKRYKKAHGLERLSEIFFRFKPLFLAFKTNDKLKPIINKIRKLATAHHKPMEEDYLNTITAKISNGKGIYIERLVEELNKVNTFRKIRLAYALKFRAKDVDSILYKIRNGKGYATSFYFSQKDIARKVMNIVLDSIISDIKKNVSGKKIYIPERMTYTLPATEKQFTGNLPSGTYVTIPKDMVFGIHWENVAGHRIDLDLSMLSPSTGKIGWDAAYRTEDRSILFSGDMTDAPKPNGATELFYVRRQIKEEFILFVNYFNHEEKVEVPFKILVAKEQVKNLGKNYMVNPNNVIAIADSKIKDKQKILGLVITTTNECRFYFAETSIGQSITSSDSEFAEHSRRYLFKYYEDTINLNEVLKIAGAKMVNNKEDCDISLAPEDLDKNSIIDLIRRKK